MIILIQLNILSITTYKMCTVYKSTHAKWPYRNLFENWFSRYHKRMTLGGVVGGYVKQVQQKNRHLCYGMPNTTFRLGIGSISTPIITEKCL